MDRNQATWTAIADFVGTLGVAATLFSATQLGGVLAIGSKLMHAGVAGRGQLQALTAKVKAIKDAGRAPTAEEWAELEAQIGADSARIREAAREAAPVPEVKDASVSESAAGADAPGATS